MKSEINIKAEGANICLIVNGRLVEVMPWDKALEVANAIRSVAKQAEEIAKAEKIIFDNAILHRAGLGVGLSRNQKILAETKKEAVHNRDLRRFMPNIKSSELVLSPMVRQEKK